MVTNFHNRETEIDILRSLVAVQENKNQVLVITGDHGVGKSTLTKHALDGVGCPVIRARIVGGTSRYVEAGYYIVRIAEALNAAAKNSENTPRFKHFARRNTFKDAASAVPNVARRSLAKTIPFVGDDLIITLEQLLGSGQFSEKDIFTPRVPANISLLERYIRYNLSITNIVIIIENAQLMDEYTLSFLQDVFINIRGQNLVLEYTDNVSTVMTLGAIAEAFENADVNIRVRSLEPLPKDHLHKLAHEVGKNIDNIDRFYQGWDGNLWTFTRVTSLSSSKSLDSAGSTDREALRQHTLALPAIPKFITFLVITHGGTAPISGLLEILFHEIPGASSTDFESAITKLTANKLCSLQDDDLLAIQHDTLVDLFCTERTKETLASSALWLQYYKIKLECKEFDLHSRSDCIVKILSFMATLNDYSALNWVAYELSQVAATSLQPRRILHEIGDVIDSANFIPGARKEALDNARLTLTKTAYNARCFEEALRLLGSVDSTIARRLRVASAIGEEKLAESIKECRAFADAADADDEHCAFMHLMMVAVRSANDVRKSGEIFRYLVGRYRHSHIPEFGYVLRGAEYNLGIPRSIYFLNKSIKLFDELRLDPECAFSENALANQKLRLGHITDARQLYNAALRRLADGTADHRTLRHNAACVSIVTGDGLDEANSTLTQVLASQQNKFSRAVVLLNRGAVRAKLQNFEYAEADLKLSLRLMRSGNVTDAEVYAIGQLNYNEVLTQLGHDIEPVLLNFSPKEFGPEVEELWDARLYGKKPSRKHLEYIGSWEYTPILLSHWLPEFSYL